MTEPERIPVSDSDVFVFRNLDIPEELQDNLIADLHERFPKNFVLLLAGDTTLETMPLDVLESTLEHLIEHRKMAGE
jgi:hypothetical protein